MKKSSAPVLASFATLKSLCDAKQYKSPYQVLSEFIRYVIINEHLYAFTVAEMKNRLKEQFDFIIPEAVVKTSLRRMAGVSAQNSVYSAELSEIGSSSLFSENMQAADENNTNIVRRLTQYIQERTGNSAIHKETVTQELIAFLVDGSISGKYSDYISEFILKNESDQAIQDNLNKIREGSVLYIGLNYNISETGSLTKPLTFYLGTEVLFSLAGYNGEIHQKYALDFMDQVRAVNTGSTARIALHYFAETKKEIEDFFGVAEDIVSGKRYHLLDKQAMIAITTGCKTVNDVTVKKADFYHLLRFSYGITEDPVIDYYGENTFKSNLECIDYIDDEDFDKKKENSIKFVSNINKLRNGHRPANDLDAEYLMITNSRTTLTMSQKQVEMIKSAEGLDYLCGFAVTLDRITSVLWYKLGKGFGASDYPVNVNVVLKARITLSSSIARSAEKEFRSIKGAFEAGNLSTEQVAARILALREKSKAPEELQADNLDEIMDFSPEFLSRYEEQTRCNEQRLQEQERLIAEIKSQSEEEISGKDAVISSQIDTIKDKDEENAKLRTELEEYKRKEAEKTEKKKWRRNVFRFAWSIAWKLMVLGIATFVLICIENKFAINVHIYAIVDAVGLLYTLWSAVKKDKEKYFPKEK